MLEFIARLRSCAIESNLTCPYNEDHDLTDYHIINRVRCGISDKSLQQELLQKCPSMKHEKHYWIAWEVNTVW